MRKHYTFYDNKVTGHDTWGTVAGEPKGTVYHSPGDAYDQEWGLLMGGENSGLWQSMSIEHVPNAFRVQLLLMGVPC